MAEKKDPVDNVGMTIIESSASEAESTTDEAETVSPSNMQAPAASAPATRSLSAEDMRRGHMERVVSRYFGNEDTHS
ncbi:hypothetical protein GCM10022247_46010 [Allokutzneria multivorans]|uniref:Uncharacterized protein n=1 Tax=Allokutzneria multivorans TaxID=1142134 RepID=A0ABP7SWW0_9PSEU